MRDARLDALEADNYVENADDAGDEAYVDSEVSPSNTGSFDRIQSSKSNLSSFQIVQGEDRAPTKRDSKRKRSGGNKPGAGGSKLM